MRTCRVVKRPVTKDKHCVLPLLRSLVVQCTKTERRLVDLEERAWGRV